MARTFLILLITTALFCLTFSSASARSADDILHLTVYDAGVAEFLEERTVELQSGLNTIEWRSLMPKAHISTIRVTAENADVVRQFVTYDGAEVRNEKSPVLHIIIQNKGAAGVRRVQVDYLAPQLDWENDYSLVLDQTPEGVPPSAATLDSWVTIRNNTGTDVAAGTVDLVAGEISLLLGDSRYAVVSNIAQQNIGGVSDQISVEPSAEVSGLSGFSRFRLGSNISMNANSPVNRFPLFQRARLSLTQRNVFENGYNIQTVSRGGFTLLPRGLEVRLVAKNTIGITMPAGLVTIYARTGNLAQIVGQDRIMLTPADGEFTVSQGRSSTLFGTRRVVERREVSYKHTDGSTRDKLMTRIEVVLTNRGSQPAEAFVREGIEQFGDNQWTIVESSTPSEKLSANSVQFKVQVPAGGRTVVTYLVEIK